MILANMRALGMHSLAVTCELCITGDQFKSPHGGPVVDYYALISKTVTNLQSPQDRGALYQRGRNALLTELGVVRPPLRKSIINKELLAFEDAIRRVEAEMAHRAQDSEWPG